MAQPTEAPPCARAAERASGASPGFWEGPWGKRHSRGTVGRPRDYVIATAAPGSRLPPVEMTEEGHSVVSNLLVSTHRIHKLMKADEQKKGFK